MFYSYLIFFWNAYPFNWGQWWQFITLPKHDIPNTNTANLVLFFCTVSRKWLVVSLWQISAYLTRWSLSKELSRLTYYKSNVFILRILSVQREVSQSPHFPPSGAKINSLIAPRLTCAFLSQRALGALGWWQHIPTSHPHQTTQCAHPCRPASPTWNPMRSQATWWAVL